MGTGGAAGAATAARGATRARGAGNAAGHKRSRDEPDHATGVPATNASGGIAAGPDAAAAGRGATHAAPALTGADGVDVIGTATMQTVVAPAAATDALGAAAEPAIAADTRPALAAAADVYSGAAEPVAARTRAARTAAGANTGGVADPSGSPPVSPWSPASSGGSDVVVRLLDICTGGEVFNREDGTPSSCTCGPHKLAHKPTHVLTLWSTLERTWEPFRQIGADLPNVVGPYLVERAVLDAPRRDHLLQLANELITRECDRASRLVADALAHLEATVGLLAAMHGGLLAAGAEPPPPGLLSCMAALVRVIADFGGPAMPDALARLAQGHSLFKDAQEEMDALRAGRGGGGTWVGGGGDGGGGEGGDGRGGSGGAAGAGGRDSHAQGGGSSDGGGSSASCDRVCAAGSTGGAALGGGGGGVSGGGAAPPTEQQAAPSGHASSSGTSTSSSSSSSSTPYDEIRASTRAAVPGILGDKGEAHDPCTASCACPPPPSRTPSTLRRGRRPSASRRCRRCPFPAPRAAERPQSVRVSASCVVLHAIPTPLLAPSPRSGIGALRVSLDDVAADVAAGGGPRVEYAYVASESA